MSATILIIEDDSEMRNIYRQSLSRQGFTIYEAANGADALADLDTVNPDIIILDMMMPDMGGTDVLHYIREKPKYDHIQFVVITAYPQYRESALNYNVGQFLTKPVRPAEIVQAVYAALESDE